MIAPLSTSNLCKDAGATVQSIDRMTLEEIFVTNVESRREPLNA